MKRHMKDNFQLQYEFVFVFAHYIIVCLSKKKEDCSMHALRTNIMYLGFPVIHCEIKCVLLCTMAACLLVVKLCLIRSNLQ